MNELDQRIYNTIHDIPILNVYVLFVGSLMECWFCGLGGMIHYDYETKEIWIEKSLETHSDNDLVSLDRKLLDELYIKRTAAKPEEKDPNQEYRDMGITNTRITAGIREQVAKYKEAMSKK